jgi:hypothetical protein
MSTTQTSKTTIFALLIALGISITFNITNTVESTNTYCMDYSKEDYSTLETGLVGDMVSIYRDTHLDAINKEIRLSQGSSYNGTRSLVIDLNTMQKFIYHIRQGLKQNGKDLSLETLGLRFYYAAYPEKNTWGNGTNQYPDLADLLGNPITESYVGRHTLVMIPTRVNGNNEVVDFNPFNNTTYEGLGLYISNLKTDPKTCELLLDKSPEGKEPVFAKILSSETEMFRNHGSMYPPYPVQGMSFQ